MDKSKKVTVHTPEEILSTADRLINSGDPHMYRSAVLEAITALEYFVQLKVFGILESKLDELLVKWLKQRTNSDFDTRLKVFTPVATNIEIDTRGNLWQRYKQAKKIRNRVAHTGRSVSLEEATEVRDTVYDWLAYLGSTAGIETELIKFKQFVESNEIIISNESEIDEVVQNYFAQQGKASANYQVHSKNNKRADVILSYGENTVLIETTLLRSLPELTGRLVKKKKQVEILLEDFRITRGVVIIFHSFEIPDSIKSLDTTADGKLSIIYIRVNI